MTGLGWQRLAPRALLIALGFALALAGRATTADSADAARGLTEVLAANEIAASPSDVHWIDGPPDWWAPYRPSRAWVLGAAVDELDDVYLAFARRTPEGSVVNLQDVYNISETRAAAERELAANKQLAGWVSGNGQELLRLQHVNLSRSPLVDANSADLTTLQRWQWRLTWLQETGHLQGISHRRFKLIPPVHSAHLRFVQDSLQVLTPIGKTTFTPHGEPVEGGEFVAQRDSGLPQPGNWITWSVDRTRHFAWFGDENMQRLKAVVYQAWDWLQRKAGLGSETAPVLVAAPVLAPSEPNGTTLETKPGAHQSTTRAWPPPAIEPLLADPQENEGQWLSLAGDPFIKPTADPLGLFYTTFIRTDPEREFSRILITAWDPLTVDLHMMSGTEEPTSATGETGTGLVPRSPGVIDNLVAAFNGGFQATHGDFGMMVEDTVFVPPLPFAATVATDHDGRAGFGTWPDNPTIPTQLWSFRQNLTPLVADGKFNPYGRTWWGGVPSDWEDDTRTVRSGLCVTNAGLIAYFYGAKVDAAHLAKAMLAMDCSYGLHLDMNQGHTGLEFYHVATAEQLPPLALTLDSMWQAEGTVSEVDGLRFRGRRMFRSMQLMNFPRFIRREARDFFFLTARPQLPRAQWQVPPSARELFPHPLATSYQKPAPDRPGTRVNLLELMPELLAPNERSTARPLLTLPRPSAETTGPKLWWLKGRAHLSEQAPGPNAQLLASGQQGEGTQAAFCVHPTSGHVFYAEVATGFEPRRDRSLLERVLSEQGCRGPIMYWKRASALALSGRDLSGHPAEPTGPRLGLSYRTPRRTFPLFPATPVVARSVWKPLQSKRRSAPK